MVQRQQVGPLQRRPVNREHTRTAQQYTAGPVPPGANQGWQAGHCTRRVAAAAHALHAVVQAYCGGLSGGKTLAIVKSQAFNLFYRHTADQRSALWRPLQSPLAQRVPANGVRCNVGVVEPVVHDQLVHQRQCQCGVGARQQGDVFMAFFSGFSLARVNADQSGAIAFGLLGITPEVQVAANRVAAPDDDEL